MRLALAILSFSLILTLISFILYIKKIKKTSGIIYVNVNDPNSEYFECVINDDFFKKVCGPKPKNVTFNVRYR